MIALTVPSCASRTTHPDIALRAPRIRTIGVVRPQVTVLQLTAGGQVQVVEEWSAAGRNNLLAAAVGKLMKRRSKLVVLEPDAEASMELDELLPLYEAVSDSIGRRVHAGMPAFDRRPPRFDYAVGPLGALLDGQGADALLVMTGYDEISTFGRKALIAVGKVTGLLFGDPPREGATFMTMALLDRDGAVLWYGELQDRGGFDLRRPGSAADAVLTVLETFPEEIR